MNNLFFVWKPSDLVDPFNFVYDLDMVKESLVILQSKSILDTSDMTESANS